MTAATRDWCERAWKEIDALPGDVIGDFFNRWEAHAKRDDVVVTFFGPYDSGKSSLLKRLLVDDERVIPDWLTVSGRRETFDLQETAVLGVIIRDTPGIAGGNELHEQLANDALLLSDFLVIVLPPQLVTVPSDKDTITEVMNGQLFGCPAQVAYPPPGLAVVFSRMDEAGSMPRDDLVGYQALVQRKLKEFAEFQRAKSVPEDLVSVYPLAADPFGFVGNDMPNGRATYDKDRGWDGVDSFAELLKDLPARKNKLRLGAEVRFLGTKLGTITASLEEIGQEACVAAEAAANEASAHALSQDKLKALLDAARADLDKRVEEEVSIAARRGAADVSELRDIVFARLEAALQLWAEKHDSAFQSLMRTVNAEMKDRRNRPAWKKLSEVLNGMDGQSEPEVEPDASSDTFNNARHLSDVLHQGFRDAYQAVSGLSLEKARGELQRLHRSASFEEYARQAGKEVYRFIDAAQAQRARRAVLVDKGFEIAVPLILELGQLLVEARLEEKEAERRVARRKKVRYALENSTKQLAEHAWNLWQDEGMPAAVEAVLADARKNADAVASALEAKNEKIAENIGSINLCREDLHQLSNGERNSQQPI